MAKYVKLDTVTKSMTDIVAGYKVKGDDMAIESIEGMTIDSCVQVFNILFNAFSQVSCSTRFRIGDMYNLIGKRDPAMRRAAMDKLREHFTDLDWQNLRTCGWVAGKWPADKRDGHKWTYFLQNHPDKPAVEKENRIPVYTSIVGKTELRAGDVVIEGQDFGGKHSIMIVSARELEQAGFRKAHSEERELVEA